MTDDFIGLAPCGIDCNTCSLRPKDCDGCHCDSDHQWCADCGIRVCCIFERHLNNCSECDSFPCQLIIDFENDQWAHHTAAVAYLRQLSAGRARSQGRSS